MYVCMCACMCVFVHTHVGLVCVCMSLSVSLSSFYSLSLSLSPSIYLPLPLADTRTHTVIHTRTLTYTHIHTHTHTHTHTHDQACSRAHLGKLSIPDFNANPETSGWFKSFFQDIDTWSLHLLCLVLSFPLHVHLSRDVFIKTIHSQFQLFQTYEHFLLSTCHLFVFEQVPAATAQLSALTMVMQF